MSYRIARYLGYKDASPHNTKSMTMNVVTYTIMMYYAYLLDPEMTKKILQATTNNYNYRIEFELSIDSIDIDSDEANYPFLPLEEFPALIDFITNVVMIQAQNEMNNNSVDILVNRWGGEDGFLDFLYDEVKGIFTKFDIYVDGGMNEDVTGMYYSFKALRDFLQYVYNNNALYMVGWH